MIKYIPIIQMVGMLLLNMLYDIFNINFYKIYDFIFEDSIVTTIMLYISSITFEFCNWHKKEQENKIIALENKVTNIEQGIFDMKSMMSQLLTKNKGD